jgi:hypothetical protein
MFRSPTPEPSQTIAYSHPMEYAAHGTSERKLALSHDPDWGLRQPAAVLLTVRRVGGRVRCEISAVDACVLSGRRGAGRGPVDGRRWWARCAAGLVEASVAVPRHRAATDGFVLWKLRLGGWVPGFAVFSEATPGDLGGSAGPVQASFTEVRSEWIDPLSGQARTPRTSL